MAYDGSLVFDTKIDSKGFEKGISGIKNAASTSIKVVGGLLAGATAAITAIGAASIKAGSNFEAGMSEVKAISGATGKDFELLKGKAKEMGATTQFSATQSAEAMKYMAMEKWSVTERSVA